MSPQFVDAADSDENPSLTMSRYAPCVKFRGLLPQCCSSTYHFTFFIDCRFHGSSGAHVNDEPMDPVIAVLRKFFRTSIDERHPQFGLKAIGKSIALGPYTSFRLD